MNALMPDTGIETIEASGNFEADYIESCKRAGVKPQTVFKFSIPLPPLPLKASCIKPLTTTESTKIESEISMAPEKGVAPQVIPIVNIDEEPQQPIDTPNIVIVTNSISGKSGIGSRKVVSERREISIQEFLKKAQIDFENGSVFALNWTENTKPYASRFKYQPTINLEHMDGDENEAEILYKIQLRGYLVPLHTLEIMHRLIPAMSNVINLTLWNCGLTDTHFPLILNMISIGNMSQISLDVNPLISEHLYGNLIGEDSCIRILSLRGNNISDVGARVLGQSLRTNRILISLDLFGNNIQKFGAEGLAESLSLAKNRIGDEGVLFLVKPLSNILLRPDEVMQRRKMLVSEVEKGKNDMTSIEDDKKKGPKRIQSGNVVKDKDKKAAKPPVGKKADPVVRANKTPEDPKTRKIATNADEKKGAKKIPIGPPGKGKKGKDDQKEDVEESLADSSEPMFEINNQSYILGNRTLNNLNLSMNAITETGLKALVDMVTEQENTSEMAADGLLGIFRISLLYNQIPPESALYSRIVELLSVRNPFYEPEEELSEGGEEVVDFNASYAGDGY